MNFENKFIKLQPKFYIVTKNKYSKILIVYPQPDILSKSLSLHWRNKNHNEFFSAFRIQDFFICQSPVSEKHKRYQVMKEKSVVWYASRFCTNPHNSCTNPHTFEL